MRIEKMYPNLKTALEAENLDHHEITDFLGIHRNSIVNKVNGHTDFTVTEAIEIWRHFFSAYDFYWLFERTEEDKN